jgi:hypothetical protein
MCFLVELRGEHGHVPDDVGSEAQVRDHPDREEDLLGYALRVDVTITLPRGSFDVRFVSESYLIFLAELQSQFTVSTKLVHRLTYIKHVGMNPFFDTLFGFVGIMMTVKTVSLCFLI